MFSKQLRALRKKNKVSQATLAGELGLTQQAIARWEKGDASPDPATLTHIARYFGVSLDELLGSAQARVGEVLPFFAGAEAPVPVMGTVRAGYGALAFEEHIGTEPAAVRDPENYFYLVVRGDSMEPRIRDGDLALVRRQPALDDGDLGVVVYGDDGEGTLKRFQHKGNAVVLQPFNPAYETVILSGEELEHLYIAGKVVETKARW